MKVSIACDHGALALKNKMISHLEAKGYEVKDFGTYTSDSCDYPDFAAAAARAVASGECEKGIVLCTTGIGMSIAANKIQGIRCALLSDLLSAKLTRQHNDTNMMALGAGVVGESLALEILDTWLSTEFSGAERHQRRIGKVMALEK
ncbi:MAG: ribose 5-phosphate isomerase B [Faecousia sp.]